jgi:hypothetical protein
MAISLLKHIVSTELSQYGDWALARFPVAVMFSFLRTPDPITLYLKEEGSFIA